MKTLELKHLAPYLPYGLRVFVTTWKCEREVKSLHQKAIMTKDYHNILDFEHIKPILKPLSDLVKDEETFDFLYGSCKAIDENIDYISEFSGDLLNTSLSFRASSILIAGKYDVFGLIEKGLAIDINTID